MAEEQAQEVKTRRKLVRKVYIAVNKETFEHEKIYDSDKLMNNLMTPGYSDKWHVIAIDTNELYQ